MENKRQGAFRCISRFALIILCNANLAYADLSVDEILDRYKMNLQKLERVSYRADVKVRLTKDGRPIDATGGRKVPVDPESRAHFALLVNREDVKIDISLLANVGDSETTVSESTQVQCRNIVVGDKWQTLNQATNNREGVVMQQSARLNGLDPSALLPNVQSLFMMGGQTLDGWVPGYSKALVDVVRGSGSAELQAAPETIDGVSTRLIVATVDKDVIKVWLDPNIDWQPRRIDLTHKEPGKDLSYVVESIEYQDVGGIQVSSACKVTFESPADRFRYDTLFTRSHVNFAPQSDIQFKMIVPKGYIVANMDSPDMPWKVVNGEFVPAQNDQVVASVDAMLSAARSGNSSHNVAPKSSGNSSAMATASQGVQYGWTWIAAISFVAALLFAAWWLRSVVTKRGIQP